MNDSNNENNRYSCNTTVKEKSTYINSYNDHNKSKIIKCQVLSKTIAINYLKEEAC